MNDDRIDHYLDSLDFIDLDEWYPEAVGWDGFPPSFDEWNARRICDGLQPGDFDEYMRDIDR